MTVTQTQTYAALAAVALVVVGTSYVVTRGASGPEPTTGSSSAGPSTGQPPLPALQTDAANRAAAVHAAEQVVAQLPTYPGADQTDRSGVLELRGFGLTTLHPPGHTIVRSSWWTVSGASSTTVAHWYAAHPPSGFHTEGGPNGVGGMGDGTTWVDEVYWDQDRAEGRPAVGTSVEVQSTTTETGAGIRITVSSVWSPARPLSSYVQDVSTIDVQSTHEHVGTDGGEQTRHTSYTISDPARVLRAATAYDDLPGMTPVFHSCPMQRDSYTDRVTFHTATGDVVATDRTQSCGAGMTVHRDGHLVDPQLDDLSRLLSVLGLDH